MPKFYSMGDEGILDLLNKLALPKSEIFNINYYILSIINKTLLQHYYNTIKYLN